MRTWAPRFEAYPAVDDKAVDPTPFAAFEGHVPHQVLDVCSQVRPSADIIVA
ncbi:hypothetical protein ACFQ9Z_33705 [Streptomyces sp. NPDC056580]|uniref:hypothetical protein n=1 Tax=Streptomyces sp. NPDC056580 TaxID=3345872 RepID=UPI0036CF8CC5